MISNLTDTEVKARLAFHLKVAKDALDIARDDLKDAFSPDEVQSLTNTIRGNLERIDVVTKIWVDLFGSAPTMHDVADHIQVG